MSDDDVDFGDAPSEPAPITRSVRQRPPDREPPHSAEAESHVLSCCLLDDGETLALARESLRADSFYSPANRLIFQTLAGLEEPGLPTLIQALKDIRQLEAVGGLPRLMELNGAVETTAHAKAMIATVRDKALLRDAIKAATATIEQAYSLTGSVEEFLAERAMATSEIAASKESAALLSACLFDDEKDVSKPAPIYTAANTTICTPGNLTCFYSQAKAGKTAIVGAMIGAAAALPGSVYDTLGFTGSNTTGKAVLCFDTEQSTYDWRQMVKTALRRVNVDKRPKWLLPYHLTGKGSIQARKMVDTAVKKAKKDFGGIYAIFIDGIADLCLDVNDAAESNSLVASLHATAIENDCAIINILHMNAGSENEKGRGHLGSQLERKCESNITLEKKDDVSSYWGIRQRGKMIPKSGAPSFQWSEEKQMHVSCEPLEKPKGKGGSPKYYEFAPFACIFKADKVKAIGRKASYRFAQEISDITESSWRDLLAEATKNGQLIRVDGASAGYLYHLPA